MERRRYPPRGPAGAPFRLRRWLRFGGHSAHLPAHWLENSSSACVGGAWQGLSPCSSAASLFAPARWPSSRSLTDKSGSGTGAKRSRRVRGPLCMSATTAVRGRVRHGPVPRRPRVKNGWGCGPGHPSAVDLRGVLGFRWVRAAVGSTIHSDGDGTALDGGMSRVPPALGGAVPPPLPPPSRAATAAAAAARAGTRARTLPRRVLGAPLGATHPPPVRKGGGNGGLAGRACPR